MRGRVAVEHGHHHCDIDRHHDGADHDGPHVFDRR
jgi:hypothetical protein